MNAAAKGRRNEYKAKQVLLDEGYLVEICNNQQYGSNDFFGLWDLIAVKKEEIRWVQVKTNRMPPPWVRDALSAFPGPGSKELWIFYDRKKEPRIINLNDNVITRDSVTKPKKETKKGRKEANHQ